MIFNCRNFSRREKKSDFALMAGPLPPSPVLMARPLEKNFCGLPKTQKTLLER